MDGAGKMKKAIGILLISLPFIVLFAILGTKLGFWISAIAVFGPLAAVAAMAGGAKLFFD
jgi:hypothetical protein